ncbi:cation-translocating P-type ATPase [Thermocrinis sp.]|uniref:heavy metal translocating P-type ATPase n=1 Tax=Thermocrinis sp. TaxID=2024383 RepID=UPI002FDE047D
MKANLTVSGMTCANCAKSIELALKKMHGVSDVKVSFELGRVWIEFDEDILSLSSIKETIESLGYQVEKEKLREYNLPVLVFCWIAGALSMFLMLSHTEWSLVTQALLSTLVQIIGGYKLYRSAYYSIKAKTGNMDLLVSLGSTSALIYSYLALFKVIPEEPLFETSLFLITFVRTGKFLEEKAKKKATEGLRRLFGLQSLKVRVLKEREEEKGVYEVFIGDNIVLRSGDMVPLDSKLVEGKLYVDESMITGESLPVLKEVGDSLLSGSLVINGYAVAKVERSFSKSYVSILIKLVERALSEKPKIHRVADRISHYFVQGVIALSILVFLLWFLKTGDFQKAITFSLAVMVISCPCAFGIAIPLAITVGLNRAYKKGIVVKKPEAFEKSIDVILIDKTGTLTKGKPKVSKANIKQGYLDIAYTLSLKSNHPYSVAVREYCESLGAKEIPLKNCKEEVGIGVFCDEYRLGRGVNGHTVLIKNGEILAEFEFEETAREESKEVLEFLKKNNIYPIIVSGDERERVRKVAELLGVEKWYAGMKPEQKLSILSELQSKGYKVGMVGDGINDAPVLAKADLSFAVGSGTDVAKFSTDVILNSGLVGLKEFFELARAIRKRIKENLLWAFGYNLLAIPIASGIFYPYFFIKPEFAGLLMALSSLSVVINSLRT